MSHIGNDKPILIEGTLKKLGFHSGKWQDRKFEIKTASLIEYNGGKIFGVSKKIILDAHSQVEAIQPEEYVDPSSTTATSLQRAPVGQFHAIRLRAKFNSGYRDYLLAAYSEESRQEWIDAFTTNIQLIRWLDGQLSQVREPMSPQHPPSSP